jgi:hypothetical protein
MGCTNYIFETDEQVFMVLGYSEVETGFVPQKAKPFPFFSIELTLFGRQPYPVVANFN